MTLHLNHTDTTGTVLHGTTAEHALGEVLRNHQWRYSRNLCAWYLPRSRYQVPRREVIAATAAALREAGHEVLVDIDTTPADRVRRDQERQERATRRALGLQARAQREASAADEAYAVAEGMAARTPIGQPILVDHHGAGAQRSRLARMQGKYAAAAEHQRRSQQAEHAAQQAAAGHGAAHHPSAVAERINRLRASTTSLQASLERDDLTEVDRTRLEDHQRIAQADLDYWQQVRRDQLKSGAALDLGPRTVRPGDQVLLRQTWFTVVRANAATVTLAKPGGGTGRVPWHALTGHRTGTV